MDNNQMEKFMEQQKKTMEQRQKEIGNDPNYGAICIYFKGEKTSPIMLQCNYNDKISNIFEKYRIFSGDHEPNKKLIYNGNILSPNLTVKESGLEMNANIIVA